LEQGADVDKVMEALVNRPFGNGTLQVEKRGTKEEENLSAESIDPFTLYIGNLPSNINMSTMREKFPTAARIDVGYAQRMKYTR
jgi:RNA recognition motif-containing protein